MPKKIKMPTGPDAPSHGLAGLINACPEDTEGAKAIEDLIAEKRRPHRPRLDPTAARIVKTYRVHPRTAARIEALAHERGISAGQVLDQLAEAAPTQPEGS